MAKLTHPPLSELDAAAAVLMNYMSKCDPLWREYIAIARAELHRTDFQLAVGWMAYVMDNGAHMVTIPRPELEPGFQPRGEQGGCAQCGKSFKIVFPGQRFCGNACADLARQRTDVAL
jgi:hypothetical protein